MAMSKEDRQSLAWGTGWAPHTSVGLSFTEEDGEPLTWGEQQRVKAEARVW